MNLTVFSSSLKVKVTFPEPTQNLPVVQFSRVDDAGNASIVEVEKKFIKSTKVTGAYAAVEVYTQQSNGFLTIKF